MFRISQTFGSEVQSHTSCVWALDILSISHHVLSAYFKIMS